MPDLQPPNSLFREGFAAFQSSTISTSRYPVLTPGSPAHTKGAWVELISSLTDLTALIIITGAYGTGSGGSVCLVDIGTGAAASEVVLIPNIFMACDSGNVPCPPLVIPITIPGGTRVSARCQSSSTSATISVGVIVQSKIGGPVDLVDPYKLPYRGVTSVEVAGANTATSAGTEVTAGTPANTKGSWVELIASTAKIARCAIVQIRGKGTASHDVDIGIGALGSETVLFPDLVITGHSRCAAISFVFFTTIPAASRLSARTGSTTALDTAQCEILLCEE